MEKTVYLTGPITGLSYKDCVEWREYAIKELAKDNIIGISPMRAKSYLSNEENISDSYKTHLSSSKGITIRDRWDTIRCNILLANLLNTKKVSIGSVVEIAWADLHRKPIITVIEKEGNPHDHGMIREINGFRVESLDEGLYIAKAILLP